MAGRLLFSNRRRNLITIFAITLTAVLFTSLFTIMLSINASYETSMFRQLGGKEHGGFKDVTPVQVEKLIKHKNIKEYGERMILGVIADDSFKNQSAEISFMDDNTAEWSFIELEEGHMPVKKNEVVMDKEALKHLGYEPLLGESIELSFNINGTSDESLKYTDTFTLSGYWEFDTLSPAHYINVSKEYARNFSEKIEGMGLDPIRIDLYVMLSSPVNAWDKMISAIEDSGFIYGEESSDDTIRIGVNPGYTMSGMDGDELLEMVIPLAAFLLLVILTGYLIIYNVFHISVANDIRFYGLLKTIGTTQQQVKRIIRLQALALCFVGIPVGLFLGFLLGSVLTPAVIETTT
ncbi:MAG: ABC transporter permease, partial [Treponema sp.]|nr:ABC transporter permease [Treponema sp.]